MSEPAPAISDFTRRTLIAVGVATAFVAAALLARALAQVFLMLFAAILFAVLLDAPARPLQRRWRVPHALGVSLVAIALAAAVVLLGWLGEPHVADQVGALLDRLPGDFRALRERLSQSDWAQALLRETQWPQDVLGSPSAVLKHVSGVFSGTLDALVSVGLSLVIGFYIAIQPKLYAGGIVRLVPHRRRDRARQVLHALGRALRWWLVGRIISMTAIGVLTAVGLVLIDMPLALGLGFVAGLFSFVPFIGPILSAVPAVLIAVVQGPWLIVYVLIVYGTVQFIEGNIITPVTQERVVALPPAVLLVSQVAMTGLFGITGLLLATPMAVAIIVIVQMLYVEDALSDRVHVLGE